MIKLVLLVLLLFAFLQPPAIAARSGGSVTRSGSFSPSRPSTPSRVSTPSRPSTTTRSAPSTTHSTTRSTVRSAPPVAPAPSHSSSTTIIINNQQQNYQPWVAPAPVQQRPMTPEEVQRQNEVAGAIATAIVVILVSFGIGTALFFLLRYWLNRPQPRKCAIFKLQVAVSAQDKDFAMQVAKRQREVDAIDPESHATLIRELALLLIRRQDSITHAFSCSAVVAEAEAQERFDEWSIMERSKLGEEVFSNVNGRIVERSSVREVDEPGYTYVLTLLLGFEGERSPLSDGFQTMQQLKDALTKMAALSVGSIVVSEVIFVPDSEEAMGQTEFLQNYPELVSLV